MVAQASGVPVERWGEERERLDKLESRLNAEIVGQQKAVAAVAGAIRRSRTGLGSGPPHGAMLFLGPTGVGKTAPAKAPAASWSGSEKALLKFDMSEYQEQHTTARLLGAPPGYLNTMRAVSSPAVRRRPYSVVLFDEIEKAHPDIQNIPAADPGGRPAHRCHGPQGRFPQPPSSCSPSNLGARFLAGQSAPLGFAAGSEAVFEKQWPRPLRRPKVVPARAGGAVG